MGKNIIRGFQDLPLARSNREEAKEAIERTSESALTFISGHGNTMEKRRILQKILHSKKYTS